MTPLRQRMLHELQRRNYSASTIRDYLGAVRQFAEHFHCSPEQLGGEHLRHYQRYLLQEKKLEPSTVEMRISALRFLYKRTLKRRDLALDDLIFPKMPHKLPTVLSQDEVVRVDRSRTQPLVPHDPGAALCHRSTHDRSGADQGRRHRQPAHGPTSARARAPETGMCRSRRSCSKNYAAGGGGRSRMAISFLRHRGPAGRKPAHLRQDRLARLPHRGPDSAV